MRHDEIAADLARKLDKAYRRVAERMCEEIPMLRLWIEKNETNPEPKRIFRRSFVPRRRLTATLVRLMRDEIGSALDRLREEA